MTKVTGHRCPQAVDGRHIGRAPDTLQQGHRGCGNSTWKILASVSSSCIYDKPMLAKTLRLMIAAACIDNAEGQLAKKCKKKSNALKAKLRAVSSLKVCNWPGGNSGMGRASWKTHNLSDILTATSHFMFVVSQKLFNIQGFGQEYFLGVTSFCAPLFSARRRFICFTRHG